MYTGLAEEGSIAHLHLIIAQITFATVGYFYSALFACIRDEIHHMYKLINGELQQWVIFCPPFGEDGEEAPVGYIEGDKQLFDAVELCDGSFVDAGNHIVNKIGHGGYVGDSLQGPEP